MSRRQKTTWQHRHGARQKQPVSANGPAPSAVVRAPGTTSASSRSSPAPLARSKPRSRRAAQAGQPRPFPGGSAAAARGARPGESRQDARRRRAPERAEAPRRARRHPREDRGPRHEPHRPARGRRRRDPGRARPAPRSADRGGCRAEPRRARDRQRTEAGRQAEREAGGARLGAPAADVEPVPRAGLQRRRRQTTALVRCRRQSADQLGAHRAPVPLLRGRRGRRCRHDGPPRGEVAPDPGVARAHAPPGTLRRGGARGPPHVPPGRRTRPRQDRAGAAGRRGRRIRTLCSPSCRTS